MMKPPTKAQLACADFNHRGDRIVNTNQLVDYYFQHAGFSWHPDTQSEFAGRLIGAQKLARAVQWFNALPDGSLEFEWDYDDTTSADFSDEEPFYSLWTCILWDCRGTPTKRRVAAASLGSIDLGRDGEPCDEFGHYSLTVEAQLLLETMTRELQS